MYRHHFLEALSHSADIGACRRMLRKGSQSFYAASMLLPQEIREPASALYAFCRLADDAIDEDHGRGHAVLDLYDRLDAMYAGTPRDIPADRALAVVVRDHRIPYALPAALIEGFEWDVAGRRYQDLSELYDYAARVAGTVGAMMTMVMGGRDPDVLARACDLGVAMQLTNIARDVGEDARAGRLYLPLDLMRETGLEPEQWLRSPTFSAEIAHVVQQLLGAADKLYARSACGIAQLPVGCRPGIFAARLIYAEIGRKLETLGLDSVSQRTVVGTSRKLQLLGRSVMSTLRSRRRDRTPPLKEVKFLVDAAAAVSP